jgi:hypothetical protein
MSGPPTHDRERRARPPRALRCYAGIGSHETPADTLALMEALAARLARDGWVLRTGLSRGADQAFYRGALASSGRVELYLPRPGFEAGARLGGEASNVHVLSRPSEAASELAAAFQPHWDRLSEHARALLARDAHQVLGADLQTPARFVACWTREGSLDGQGLYGEGTGQALRIAHDRGVPVVNLARPEHVECLADRWCVARHA